MEINSSQSQSGSLQISSAAIQKIARLAALEVEGVADIAFRSASGKGFVGTITQQKPINVQMKDDVADMEIALVVKYGTKIPDVSEKVQANVKQSIQNMTTITVGRIDVVITGVVQGEEADAPA